MKSIRSVIAGITQACLLIGACALLPIQGDAADVKTGKPDKPATMPAAAKPAEPAKDVAGPGEAVKPVKAPVTTPSKVKKTTKKTKKKVTRETRSSLDEVGSGQLSPGDVESLLQALKPLRDVKKNRINVQSLQAMVNSQKGGNVGYWSRIGLKYSAANEYDSAIAAFSAAAKADPRDGSAYFNRAVMRQKSGQYRAAIEDYTRAARLAPGDADIYYNRGMAYQCLGQSKAAIDDYTRAILRRPGDPRPFWNRGVVYSRQGRDDLASRDYCSSLNMAFEEKELERWKSDHPQPLPAKTTSAAKTPDDGKTAGTPEPAAAPNAAGTVGQPAPTAAPGMAPNPTTGTAVAAGTAVAVKSPGVPPVPVAVKLAEAARPQDGAKAAPAPNTQNIAKPAQGAPAQAATSKPQTPQTQAAAAPQQNTAAQAAASKPQAAPTQQNTAPKQGEQPKVQNGSNGKPAAAPNVPNTTKPSPKPQNAPGAAATPGSKQASPGSGSQAPANGSPNTPR